MEQSGVSRRESGRRQAETIKVTEWNGEASPTGWPWQSQELMPSLFM